MKITEPHAIHRMVSVITGETVIRAVKLYRDAKSFYKTVDETIADETVMYEVYQYTEEDDSHPGHLSWGLTILNPVTVSGECNMTRGHFHEDLECAEFYYGVSGHGLLLLMDEQGDTWAEQVFDGSLHYIKGIWAHRLVNTGDEPLKVAACWPSSAGHDYDRVSAMPFGYRIYKQDGNLEMEAEERA